MGARAMAVLQPLSVAAAARVCQARPAASEARWPRPVPEMPATRLVCPLTARELEVLSLMCDGESNREIARRLRVQLATVKYHLNQIFGKLCVQRRTMAVAVAIHLRLVQPQWLQPWQSAASEPPPR